MEIPGGVKNIKFAICNSTNPFKKKSAKTLNFAFFDRFIYSLLMTIK